MITKAQEFDIWLEGFNEAIEGSPTDYQMEKMRRKLAEMNQDCPGYGHGPMQDNVQPLKVEP